MLHAAMYPPRRALLGCMLALVCTSGCNAYQEDLLSPRRNAIADAQRGAAGSGVPAAPGDPAAGADGLGDGLPLDNASDAPAAGDAGAGTQASMDLELAMSPKAPDAPAVTDSADSPDASTGAAAQSADAGATAGPPHDAAVDQADASMPMPVPMPAERTIEDLCNEELARVVTDDGTCVACACQRCAEDVMRCFDSGETSKDAACVAVLDCSVQHGCAGFDCYCADASCGWASGSANGPCALQIEAAANGKQQAVADQTDAGDLTTALGRLNAVLACMVDLHPSTFSSGPQVLGGCREECSWRSPW